MPRSFWTHTIVQMSHNQPAIRYAAVSISSLFEDFQNISANDQSANRLAISRYNIAIRHIATSNDGCLDTAIIASILFMSIELLRGCPTEAMIHYKHGRRILASYNASPVLLNIFHHLNVFALYLSDSLRLPLLSLADLSPPPPFVTLIQAQETLDWLTYRSMKVAFALDQSAADPLDQEAFLQAQLMKSALDTDLDAWSHDAGLLTSSDSVQGTTTYQMLQVRWLVCKIWTDADLYENATDITDEMFRFSSNITFGVPGVNTSKLGEFLSSTEISPILYYMLMKCNKLQIRLAALALFRKKCRSRDISWDYKMLYLEAKRAIEKDHGVLIDLEWKEAEELENLIGVRDPNSPICRGFQFMCPWPIVLMDVCERVHQSSQ
ncbi:C6 zinc finger domain-containing protein [Penicillium pulvis]|uniref:C6 zinc finger domain-containing protein n=1 Tax=Penicillium pulvis TaxID=1562058 RepID=UPI00254659EE|nr:C6 zinc finger domain-containing protein [Penicillium pulvis]KAJ5809186.1 C6 zinc finger domain-containing protein [Penicillium pulvis]